jgi:PKD repeat protein
MKHLSTLLILLFCSSYLAHATDPCIGFGAGFTFDIDDATQTTTFINQATGNYGNNIQWSFYDNGNYTYSSDINPVYTPQGDFFVCMDIWSYWCYSSTCKWIVLSDTVPPCQANFEYAANNNNVLGINFTDQSSNYFVTDPQGNQITLDYLWDFGDGQTATDPNPVHDYTSAGIYTVCLYINNPFTNCGDTTCYNVPVNVSTCQANFDYQISYDQSDGIYHADFNNTSYSLVTGATVTYLWDFGDGQSSVQLNPTHVYTSPGQYTACLSIFVQDNAGAIVCTDSTCYNLIISNCNANFDYVVDNNDVNFSDFSTTDTGEITTWLWNFDDGLSSFEQNPTHLYTAPGTYTVCQTITTSWGCTSTWCDDITVTGCVADFDFVTGYNVTANTYLPISLTPQPPQVARLVMSGILAMAQHQPKPTQAMYLTMQARTMCA